MSEKSAEAKEKYDCVSMGSCTLDIIMGVTDVMRFEVFQNDTEKKYIAIEYSTKKNVNDLKTFPGGSAANMRQTWQ